MMALWSCEEHSSTFCASLLVVHSAASTMTAPLVAWSFLLFCSSAPGCQLLLSDAGSRHTPRYRDNSERDRWVDVVSEVVTKSFGSVEVLTIPTKAHGSVPVLRSC